MNFKNLIVLFFFIYSLVKVKSATCTAISDGNWNNPSIWSCGFVPSCGDLIIIPSGINVTINVQVNLSSCSPTPAMSPNFVISGTLTFLSGNKIRLPCGSNFYLNSGGALIPGGGGGSSNLLEICDDIYWTSGMGPLNGPTCYPPGCALPLEIVKFEAKYIGNRNVLINWETLNEEDIEKYLLYKSFDGLNYEEIFTINSDKIPDIQKYSFLDKNIKDAEIIYYQLKSINNRGELKKYQPIYVFIENEISLEILPNPGNGMFFLKSSLVKGLKYLKLECEIYDNKNTFIKKINLTLKNQTNIPLDLTDLAEGIYYFKTFYVKPITLPIIIIK